MDKPIIFFVHVPKTAGSTVNALLHEHEPNGREHVEHILNNPKVLRESVEKLAWMSGHVHLTAAENRLTPFGRTVRYFTCIREPAKQVMSSYNWLIEIFQKGPQFYDPHPPQIKEISETIRASSDDADSIIANLKKFPNLFLNFQSRTILGHGFNWNSGAIHQRLDQYEMIAEGEGVGRMVSAMLGKPVAPGRKENVSSYHFDPAAFETDQMREFLRTHNTLDNILYELVRSRTSSRLTHAASIA